MANKTVYPYGTDGSLPSSIGVINDLTTGGTTDALSAEQGKVIGQYLFTSYDPISLSSLTLHNFSLGANTSSSNRWTNSIAKHYAVPVTAGTKVRLNVSSTQADGGFYGFFTQYVEPTESNSALYYVQGRSRVWLNKNTSSVVTVPDTATYLIIGTKDGDGHTSTWSVSVAIPRGMEGEFVPTSDIVDNLTSGGSTKVLSAEQGKVLAGMITEGGVIPSGLTKYAYTGAKVKIDNGIHYTARNTVATITSVSCQGGACYGDYLFMFTENNTTCWVYSLATSNLLQTITIPSEERGFVSNAHCNTVNFGTEKYNSSDPFPLIYVSTGYSNGGYTGALVYRVVVTTESDVSTYSLSLVQTLKIPTTPSSWTEFVTGDDGNCYICYTSINTIYRMALPKLSEGDVIFDLDNALEVYKFTPQPASWNGSRGQGRMYYNGKIVLVSGVPSSSEKSVFVVLDLATRTREVVIDLQSVFGINSEPETVFIWNGHYCIVFRSNSGVTGLYFE